MKNTAEIIDGLLVVNIKRRQEAIDMRARIQELEEFAIDVRDTEASPLCFMPMMKRRAAEVLKGRTSK